MNKAQNQNFIGADFAFDERQAMLRRVPRQMKHRNTEIAPGIIANQVWGHDVSGSDSRSVKAYLNGNGDFRVLWWRLCSIFIGLVHPRANLEEKMFCFHKYHQERFFQSIEDQSHLNPNDYTVVRALKVALARNVRLLRKILGQSNTTEEDF